MESVFDNVGAQIDASVMDAQPSLLKLQRSAFVFITAESGSTHAALEDLRKIDAVQEVYLARGAYDLVAKISGDSLEDLREDALRRIRSLSSIKSTLTLTVI
ncbi:MAG: Lrp/AsnC ligand binding domain-containing protein [Candidatus Bathyarchaeota archaeon]|nr:Lrp/AsnC ligand binding domain-containing protein [Candidatus Bathyarchaeota archaeon]